MAVQQNKEVPVRVACTALTISLTNPPLAVEATTGECTCVTFPSTGFYRGKSP